MKKRDLLHLILPIIGLLAISCEKKVDGFQTISEAVLKDKIAGGWAGKMIGVTYGAPTEFRAQEKMYDDSINWKPSDVRGSIWQDDIYVQLTFLMTMDKYGMDAPAKKFQEQFAKAGYQLWHANVQARKNYFDSIFPPQSGSPEFNIHADDIDFQIEADYIGFMCPGMPKTASIIADKIGRIMNYGDGIYGGIFVAALYSEAYFDTSITKIINKALLSIPAESDYAKIVRDVIILHDNNPLDWRAAWKELEAKWGNVDICGAGNPFNIDAKLNGAYIVMGLLYGDGNPEKTMEIATRCGQDSDCNPSNAMAVLGVIKGLSGLPKEYQDAVRAIGDTLFINTDYNFNKAVENTLKYAKDLIIKDGGQMKGSDFKIKIQEPSAPVLEVAFPDVVFAYQSRFFEKEKWNFKGSWKENKVSTNQAEVKDFSQAIVSDKKGDEVIFTFEGTGVSLVGNWVKDGGKADIYIDGKLMKTINTYFDYANQVHYYINLYHVTGLSMGKHELKVVVKGEKCPEATGANIYLAQAIVFKTEKKKNDTYKFSFEK